MSTIRDDNVDRAIAEKLHSSDFLANTSTKKVLWNRRTSDTITNAKYFWPMPKGFLMKDTDLVQYEHTDGRLVQRQR